MPDQSRRPRYRTAGRTPRAHPLPGRKRRRRTPRRTRCRPGTPGRTRHSGSGLCRGRRTLLRRFRTGSGRCHRRRCCHRGASCSCSCPSSCASCRGAWHRRRPIRAGPDRSQWRRPRGLGRMCVWSTLHPTRRGGARRIVSRSSISLPVCGLAPQRNAVPLGARGPSPREIAREISAIGSDCVPQTVWAARASPPPSGLRVYPFSR